MREAAALGVSGSRATSRRHVEVIAEAADDVLRQFESRLREGRRSRA
jgi:hypothetical protein